MDRPTVFYDQKTGKLYPLEYDQDGNPSNFTVNTQGQFILNKDVKEIEEVFPDMLGPDSIWTSDAEYQSGSDDNQAQPTLDPTESEPKKKKGRPKKINQ